MFKACLWKLGRGLGGLGFEGFRVSGFSVLGLRVMIRHHYGVGLMDGDLGGFTLDLSIKSAIGFWRPFKGSQLGQPAMLCSVHVATLSEDFLQSILIRVPTVGFLVPYGSPYRFSLFWNSSLGQVLCGAPFMQILYMIITLNHKLRCQVPKPEPLNPKT